MAGFWIAAGAMALAVAATLLAGLRRAGAPARDGAAAARRFHAAELDAIARDRDRGALAPAEAEGMRAEVARRLLRAGAPEPPAGRGPAAWAAVLAAASVLGGGVWLYLVLGAPGYPDLPLAPRIAEAERLRAARPAQAAAEAATPPRPGPEVDPEYAALIATLRTKVAERPDDLTGHRLLAENEARLGNAAAARAAQERVVAIRGAAADAADYRLLARYRIQAAGGVVTAEAEAALAAALARDPDDAEALFLAGIAQMQVGRPDLAFPHWARAARVVPADSPRAAEIARGLPLLAAAAGAEMPEPTPAAAPARGPDAAAVEAAGAMAADDRAEMIRGMVEGLAARLAAEGGPAADWARLISSLGVLGETDRARAIWAEAQGRFAGREDDLATIRAAARAAGVEG